MAETDRGIRTTRVQDSRQVTEGLRSWLKDREQTVVRLAALAEMLSAEEMQARLEQAHLSDTNLTRIALMNKAAVVVAFAPMIDDLGRNNIGKSFADRAYLAQLKATLRPMLSDGLLSRFGRADPIAAILAPVVLQGAYAGYVAGVLNLDRMAAILMNNSFGEDLRYTLIDRNGHVILTNRADQEDLRPFSRGQGIFNPVDEGVLHWIPALPPNTSTIDLWGKSLYVTESGIGDPAEWRLILEQPVAPFQKRLYNRYSGSFFLLFAVLIVALILAEFLGRRMASSMDRLVRLTRAMPSRLASDQRIAWPESVIKETSRLIPCLKLRSQSLM